MKGYNMKYKTYFSYLILILFFFAFNLFSNTVSDAKITGPCANCHTMHNSQNGAAVDMYGAAGKPWKVTGPLPALTRGTCLGCHGMGTASKIVTIGGSEIPQVYHTEGTGLATDLAGGNFAYILNAKPRVTADGNSAGHNVVALGQNETILTVPPSGEIGHPMSVTNTNLRCAGKFGCHGTRLDAAKSELQQLKGAHHQNVDGKCNTADTNYNSYRFLRGVKGLENTGTYKWQNYDANNHNEYFGATTPMSMPPGCAAAACHGPDMAAMPANNTISGFCATCHGSFHSLQGIGGDTSSPFTRHPTDVVLKGSGEYASYITYSVEAPVARQTVFDSITSTVTPGTDVVMCLSCHSAHATPYADILKWDYTSMIAGGGGSGGCFTCHTQKK